MKENIRETVKKILKGRGINYNDWLNEKYNEIILDSVAKGEFVYQLPQIKGQLKIEETDKKENKKEDKKEDKKDEKKDNKQEEKKDDKKLETTRRF